MSSTPLTERPLESVLEPALTPVVVGRTPARSSAWQMTARAWTLIRVALDLLMYFAGSVAAAWGAPRVGLMPLSPFWTLAFGAALFTLIAGRGLYRRPLQAHVLDDARSIVAAVTIAAGAVLSLRAFTTGIADADELLREWAFVGVYLLAGRVALQWSFANASRAGQVARPTLIVGRGRIGALVAERLAARPELGLVPVGFLDKDPLPLDDAPAGIPVLGASWDLERVVREHRVDQVIVAFSSAPNEVMLRLVRRCEALGVDVAFVPRFFERIPEHVTVEHLGGLSLLVPRRVDTHGWYFRVKYAVDRVVAALALVLVSPLLGAIALAVRVTMGKPVLFRQERVGRDGKPFQMLKFRSMRTPRADAPAFVLPEGLGPGGVEGVDRTTRLGRFLRDTSLDELPQLLNVVRGEMSIVGPRPERPEFVARFERSVYRYGDRHRVKAGITGWAQVHGLRGRTSIADRAEWDNFYIENFSLWLDLKIVLLTAGAMLRMLVPFRA